MKRFSLLTIVLAAAFTLPTFVASAQTRAPQTQRGAVNTGSLDSKTSGANVRVSQLMGLNIQNSQGESVGEIHDLVVDGNSGKIRYVAVTYGGLFGLGDKLFAVPYEAFKVTRDPDDADDVVMVLDVTREQLEGAQGFDQDHWPDMADRNMLRELDKRYKIDRSTLRDRSGRTDVNVNAGRRGVNVDVDRE